MTDIYFYIWLSIHFKYCNEVIICSQCTFFFKVYLPFSSFFQLTRSRIHTSSSMLSQWSNVAVQKYIQQCGALTWQMVIQKPPMKLCYSDCRFDERKHKLWWSCDQSKARKINYFVWPVLYDYEDGNMMIKGCVHASWLIFVLQILVWHVYLIYIYHMWVYSWQT